MAQLFVSPEDDTVVVGNTLNIENMWMRVKGKFECQFGIGCELFSTGLDEFICVEGFTPDLT